MRKFEVGDKVSWYQEGLYREGIVTDCRYAAKAWQFPAKKSPYVIIRSDTDYYSVWEDSLTLVERASAVDAHQEYMDILASQELYDNLSS